MTDSQSLRQCAAILLSNNRDASYTIACAVRDAREIAREVEDTTYFPRPVEAASGVADSDPGDCS
jgi:hypothetical protein